LAQAALFAFNGAWASFAVLYRPLEEDGRWSRVSFAGAATLGQLVMGASFIAAGGAILATLATMRLNVQQRRAQPSVFR
jgi:hypothetical protein